MLDRQLLRGAATRAFGGLPPTWSMWRVAPTLATSKLCATTRTARMQVSPSIAACLSSHLETTIRSGDFLVAAGLGIISVLIDGYFVMRAIRFLVGKCSLSGAKLRLPSRIEYLKAFLIYMLFSAAVYILLGSEKSAIDNKMQGLPPPPAALDLSWFYQLVVPAGTWFMLISSISFTIQWPLRALTDEWQPWLGSEPYAGATTLWMASISFRVVNATTVLASTMPIIICIKDYGPEAAGTALPLIAVSLTMLAIFTRQFYVTLRPYTSLVIQCDEWYLNVYEEYMNGRRTMPPSVLRERSLYRLRQKYRRVSVRRWRSPAHEAGYRLATSIERITRLSRKRLTADQYALLFEAFTSLAEAIRRESIVASRRPPIRQLRAVYGRAAISLLTFVDPSEAARAVQEVTADEPARTVKPRTRLALLLETLTAQLEKQWPAVKILLTILIAVWFLSNGNVEKVVDLLTK